MIAPTVVDGRLARQAINTAGGHTIQFDIPHHWQNPLNFNDVNNDGNITAVDALRVINELNGEQFSNNGVLQSDATPAWTEVWRFFDVSGDDQVTALDALRIINQLNRVQASSEPLTLIGTTQTQTAFDVMARIDPNPAISHDTVDTIVSQQEGKTNAIKLVANTTEVSTTSPTASLDMFFGLYQQEADEHQEASLDDLLLALQM
jgi:hypothetical protein